MPVELPNVCFEGKNGHNADVLPCCLMTQGGHSIFTDAGNHPSFLTKVIGQPSDAARHRAALQLCGDRKALAVRLRQPMPMLPGELSCSTRKSELHQCENPQLTGHLQMGTMVSAS